MDQNFQTSFIPKKPILEERSTPSRPVGLLTILSIFVFFTMVIATGGLYFYKSALAKQISDMNNSLTLAKGQFEPDQIARIQLLDKRLTATSDILSKHIALSPIFGVLQQITEKSIRYTSFSYSVPDDNSSISVKMTGTALSYQDIALQADLYSQNKNLINPVFSNLSLNKGGNVLFNLSFSVDPHFVDYKQVLETKSNNSPSSIDNTTTTGATTN